MVASLLQTLPWRRVVKFTFVGGTAFAMDFVIYLLLTRVGHAPYLLSRVISIGAAFAWNFTLNRQWTFRAHEGKVARQAGRFLVVMVLTSLLNLGLMHVGVSRLHLNDVAVMVGVSLLIMGVNFLAHSLWSYK